MRLPFALGEGGRTRSAGWRRWVTSAIALAAAGAARPTAPRRGSATKGRTRPSSGPRHAPAKAGRRRPPPRGGRLEALGWFIAAAVILAWPRERSPFDWPRLDWSKVRWPKGWPKLSTGHDRGADVAKMEILAAETLEPGRGRAARSPMQIPLRGWRDIIWRAWTEFNRDNIMQVAGGVAFFNLLAMFPAMAAFVSLYGLFSSVDTARKQLRLLAGVVPADTLTFIGDQMVRIAAAKHAGLGVAFVVGLLFSIWSANAGMKALFLGLNIAFEEKEKRNFLKLNLMSLTFTLGAIFILILALGAVVVAPVVLAMIGYQGAGMAILRWPLLLLATVGGLALLYRFGPSRHTERWRWISWGSTIAAVLWLAVSMLFSLYVTNFGHYGRTYGSLGAVIGFMSWMWISAIAVLFGAELNSEIEHQTAADTTTGADKPMGVRGAHMADTLGPSRPKGKAAAKARAATRSISLADLKETVEGRAR